MAKRYHSKNEKFFRDATYPDPAGKPTMVNSNTNPRNVIQNNKENQCINKLIPGKSFVKLNANPLQKFCHFITSYYNSICGIRHSIYLCFFTFLTSNKKRDKNQSEVNIQFVYQFLSHSKKYIANSVVIL